MADEAPKSAVELAMERLSRQDAEAGETAMALSEEQKAAIAEARRACEAKTAERRILHESAMATTVDPEARAELDREYRQDLARFASERDRRIERIRDGSDAS